MRLHAQDCRAAGRRAFVQWRDAHPQHALEYEAMREIWEVWVGCPIPTSASRPKAADGQVRATGTQFNVWKYQDQVRVTLLEGSVLVTSNEALPLINRYLQELVLLADTDTGMIRIGGVYNISQLHSLVPSLPKVLPVYLTLNADGRTVLNSRPK